MHEFRKLVPIKELWRSSNNITWLAEARNDGVVVVKMPRTNEALKTRRLILEIWFLHELAGVENIVPLLHHETDASGVPKLVMPFMSQGSLSHRLYHGSLSVTQGVQIIAFVADALQRIHSRGILHLDVNPGNILLDSHGTPFLTDFGHAMLSDPNAVHLVDSDQARELLTLRSTALAGGTWEYMPPEQFDLTAMELSPSADIYALGISLYEVLARRKPHKSYAVDPSQRRTELRSLHMTEPPLDMLECTPRLVECREIKEVVAMCLKTDPEARYKCASELAGDLRAIVA